MLKVYGMVSRGAAVLALITSLFLVSACGDGSSSATVESLALTPSAATIAAGTTQQFTGVATLSDGTTEEIPAGATWSSSDTGVASVNQTGLASGVSPGTTTISLSAGDLSITATLTVTDATLDSIAVTPTAPSIAAGTDQAFIATGTFSDMSTQDMSTSVSWTSSNTSVATVGAAGLASSTTVGSTDITATSGAVSGSSTLTVTAATLVSISVEPAAPSIADGTTQQFVATGIFSDSSTQDLSATATWTSSATAVATIDSAGLATGESVGTSTIAATSGAVTGDTVLTVTAAELVSLAITPPNPTIADGTDQQFVAMGTFTDSTVQDLSDSVTWASSNTGIATISNATDSEGLASALLAGTTTISATSGSVSTTTNLNVTNATLESIAVTPVDPSTALGVNEQFTAIGTFSDSSVQDVTTSVTWTSSNESFATVSNGFGSRGLATPVAVGTTTITATDPNNNLTNGSSDLTVTAAVLDSLQVDPNTASAAAGRTQDFTATGFFSDGSNSNLTASATWTSSNNTVATVGANTGVATGNVVGTVTITASVGAVSDTASFTVTSAVLVSLQVDTSNASVPLGIDSQYTATGTFSDSTVLDLTESVTWSVTANGVASVSNATGNRGLVSSLTTGSTTVTATDSSTGSNDSLGFTVTDAVLASIAVTGTNSIPDGTSTQLAATGIFTDSTIIDLTGTATWADSDGGTIVSVSNGADRGLASAVSPGASSVTATQSGVTSPSFAFTVTNEVLQTITVLPANPSIAKGTSQLFTATGNYSGGTSLDIGDIVTWSTSAVAASVNQSGLATGDDVGAANVIATVGVISGSTILTVTAAELVEIVVTPPIPSIALGRQQQFAATGIFTDGTQQILTESLTWLSLSTGVATVSNVATERGLTTSVSVGSSEIVATDPASGLSDSAILTVTNAVLESIDLSPLNSSVAAIVGETTDFTAIGNFSDGSTPDITNSVTWASTATTIATIDPATGEATTNIIGNTGDTTISATDTATPVTASTILTVTGATLVSIEVTSNNQSVALGSEEQFTATGLLSDGRSTDLTATATWSCPTSPPDSIIVAAIDAAGLASADNLGTCTATAVVGAVTGTRGFEVTDKELVTIVVCFDDGQVCQDGGTIIALGLTQPFSATGIFTDDSTEFPLSGLTWTSANGAVASVNPSTGLATSLDVGSSSLTASRDGVFGSANLAVSAATLVSIAVTSNDPNDSIANGTTAQFTADGTFTDGSVVDLTTQVNWTCPVTSGSGPIVTISNVVNLQGSAIAQNEGSCDATATFIATSTVGSLSFDVTNALLVSIAIVEEDLGGSPGPLTTPLGTSRQLTALATFTDSTVQDFTDAVSWAPTSDATAFLLNGAANRGLAVPVSLGSITVTATVIPNPTIGAVAQSDTAGFEVTAAELVSLKISPEAPSVNQLQVLPLSVEGTYTDNSRVDHTSFTDTDWASGNTGVASVGNGAGNKGIATGQSVDGFAIISATDTPTGISAQVCMTVGTGVCPTTPLIAIDASKVGSPNMYSIDQNTGVATLLAGVDDELSAIAFDNSGTLLGMSPNSGLVSINTSTGAFSVVNNNFSDAPDMTVAPDGTIYAPTCNDLSVIDSVSGASSPSGFSVVSRTIAAHSSGVLVFHDESNCGGGNRNFFEIDGGSVNDLGFGYNESFGKIKALTFVGDVLYAITQTGEGPNKVGPSSLAGSTLITIDDTGTITLIGSENGLPSALDSLAFFNDPGAQL